jgi:hypothetical protein
MRAASIPLSPGTSRAPRATLLGGAVAGILDITYAFLFYGAQGVSPIRILQSISSGLLGKDAYTGGLGTAALGAVLHFFIAFTACAVYYAASRKLQTLVQRPVVWGLLYGVAVYLFMNLVVIPLSAVPGMRYSTASVVGGLLVHMLFVGLPISLAVRRYSTA